MFYGRTSGCLYKRWGNQRIVQYSSACVIWRLSIALTSRNACNEVWDPILEELMILSLKLCGSDFGCTAVFVTQVDQWVTWGLFHVLLEINMESRSSRAMRGRLCADEWRLIEIFVRLTTRGCGNPCINLLVNWSQLLFRVRALLIQVICDKAWTCNSMSLSSFLQFTLVILCSYCIRILLLELHLNAEHLFLEHLDLRSKCCILGLQVLHWQLLNRSISCCKNLRLWMGLVSSRSWGATSA